MQTGGGSGGRGAAAHPASPGGWAILPLVPELAARFGSNLVTVEGVGECSPAAT